MPKLTQLTGPKPLPPIELTETLIMVGRTEDNTVCLDDRSVSKHHAVLVNEEGRYRLIDLHATNGTFVNTQRIESAELHHGDQIQIGAFAFGYEHEREAADMVAAATPPPTAIPVTSLTSVPPAVAKGVGVPKMEKTVISEGPPQTMLRLRREEPSPAEAPPPVARLVTEPEPAAQPAEDATLVKPHPTPTSTAAGKSKHFIRLPTDRAPEPPAQKSGLIKKLVSREKPAEPTAPAVPAPAPEPEQPAPAKPKIMRLVRGPGAPPIPPRPIPIQKLAAAVQAQAPTPPPQPEPAAEAPAPEAVPPPVEPPPPPPAPEPPLVVAALVEPPPPAAELAPPPAPTPEPELPPVAATPAEPEPAPPPPPPAEPPIAEPPPAVPEKPLVAAGGKEAPEEIATKPATPESERELRFKPKPQAEDRPLFRGPAKAGAGDQLIVKKPGAPKE